jgi:DNA invertase Pin-like site-specific DNA recombinase
MIRQVFNPMLALIFVMYARMSSKKQNERSPDQQFSEILERIDRLKYPWKEAARYRDDGISGRKIKKRPSFQRMLNDIFLGRITPKPNLLIVDTPQRFGRTEEMQAIRKKLADHGVLVLTVESNFADPTGLLGKTMGLVDNIRSEEDNKTKAHDVIRGKKDAVMLGRWPGGPPPIGFSLKKIFDDSLPHGFYSVLEPDEAVLAHVTALFVRADETGHGRRRLGQWWNANPNIPDEYKPISESQTNYILKNEIYIGRLIWGANNTDIFNDTHVRIPNPDGPFADNKNFCAPVVAVDLFERVRNLIQLRSDAHAVLQPKNPDDDNSIPALGRGLPLKYLLAGLVRCGLCKSVMRTTPSRHTEKGEGGKVYEYVHHSCPRGGVGGCNNHRYFRADKLCNAAIGRLRAKLFPLPSDKTVLPDWLPELYALVEADIARACEERPDLAAARQAELDGYAKQIRGWMMSLADPGLDFRLRGEMQKWIAEAQVRFDRLKTEIESEAHFAKTKDSLLDPKEVVNALRQLDEVLAGSNPTLGNVELRKHIDRIVCHADGKVVLRGTTLGVLGEAACLLTRSDTHAEAEDGDNCFPAIQQREHSRRNIPNLLAQEDGELDQITLLSPDRFAGFGEEFFWEEELVLERDTPWYQSAAAEVARERNAGKTHAELAVYFDKTVPTIRSSLKFAAETDPSLVLLPKKMPRARWEDSHYAEVARMRAEGVSVAEMSRIFDVSEPLIRNALKIAVEKKAEAESEAKPAENPDLSAA